MARRNEGLGKRDDGLPKTMEVCPEKTESYLEKKESIPVETASVEAHPEDSNEEATVETVRELEGRYEERHLDVGHRRKLKKRNQVHTGSHKKLAAVRR
jgi:hypothetical protein